MTRALLLTLLLADAALAKPASKLPPVEAEWLARGNRHLERREYQDAIAAYQAGYAVAYRPVFLFNIGQAKRFAGDCQGAVAAYRSFIETRPEQDLLVLAERNIGRCPVAESPPAPTPAPATQPAPTPTPPPAPTPPAPRVRHSPWYEDVLGDALAGTGLISAGVGTWLFLDGRADVRRENDLARDAPDSEVAANHLAAADSAYTREKIGVILLAAGATLTTAAILRYTLRDSTEEVPTTMAIVPSADGLFVTAAARW
jgi:tetratricopeptide (TPR) repeat protein